MGLIRVKVEHIRVKATHEKWGHGIYTITADGAPLCQIYKFGGIPDRWGIAKHRIRIDATPFSYFKTLDEAFLHVQRCWDTECKRIYDLYKKQDNRRELLRFL